MLAKRWMQWLGLMAALTAWTAAAGPVPAQQQPQVAVPGQQQPKKVEAKPSDPKSKPSDPKPKTDAKKVKSKIKVTVPEEDAELQIDGKPTKPTGLVREFVTPEIDAGKDYYYDFSVTWRPNNYTVLTRTKRITFKGGEDIFVDLSKPDPRNPDKAVVRWVPTPQDIVEKMVELAGVKDGDVVYEPGPGDGRVLITSVKRGAKKAVGIELDPKKAEEARANAKKAGVADRVEIRVGDALQVTDYGEATVIMLYMGDEFNNLLRPLFEKQLKPGTRIVSHRFTMGDWKPDKTITVQGEDGDEYVLHLWIVKEKKTSGKNPEKK